jgi:hypothetical protein
MGSVRQDRRSAIERVAAIQAGIAGQEDAGVQKDRGREMDGVGRPEAMAHAQPGRTVDDIGADVEDQKVVAREEPSSRDRREVTSCPAAASTWCTQPATPAWNPGRPSTL